MIPLRGLLVPLLAALVLIAIGCHARAADKPQIDCALVRQYVAEHGKAAALSWAIRNGYSWREIQEARRCLAQAR